MKQGGPSGPAAKRTRLVFVTVQVALAVVLLIGSGLVVRALQASYAIPLGFETNGLVLATVDPPPLDDPARRDLANRMQAGVERQLGVRRASLAAQVPLQGGAAFVTSIARVRDTDAPVANGTADVLRNDVAPGYFDTLGIPIRHGRGFSAEDTYGSEPVVVINEALARERWPNENPEGTLIRLGHEQAPRTVIGVVAQAQHIGLAGRHAEGIYLPLTQVTTTAGPTWVVLLRPRADLPSAVRGVQHAIDEVGSNLLLYDVRSMDEQFAKGVFPQRTMAVVSAAFGLLALLLTAAGLTAAVSFVVHSARMRSASAWHSVHAIRRSSGW